MATLELEDIQGLVFRGYGSLPAASYHLLSFSNATQARGWLRRVGDRVARGPSAPRTAALHLAFTYSGLRKLGAPKSLLDGLPPELIEGMAHPNRARLLGDIDSSAPTNWLWGGPSTPSIDALLIVFAQNNEKLKTQQDAQRAEWSQAGVQEVRSMHSENLDGKEHFGFADGISQPLIEGFKANNSTDSKLHTVKAGEFVLGYENEYGLYTDRPLLDPSLDPKHLLSSDAAGSSQRDFGRNGSYLVFRQLRQDVAGFRETLDRLTRDEQGKSDARAAAKLAAQMVGRWPSGAPLTRTPSADDPGLADDNEFRYHAEDGDGRKCPFGSHIRRTNPRDSLDPSPGTDESLQINRRHRILRRGREYGAALPEGARDHVDRGLLFIGLNANIARQFEFIQHTWLNNPKFAGLYRDADPIVGYAPENQFTVQAEPVRKRYLGLPRFVDVVGGAYFFLPGVRALRYLGELQS